MLPIQVYWCRCSARVRCQSDIIIDGQIGDGKRTRERVQTTEAMRRDVREEEEEGGGDEDFDCGRVLFGGRVAK